MKNKKMNSLINRLGKGNYKKIKIGRNDPCWCGCGRKYKQCHEEFDKKLEKCAYEGYIVPPRDIIKTANDVEMIKKSAAINMACLDAVSKEIHIGMNTQEIDDIINKVTGDMGGIPAPLNYEGFPKSVCTSVNEQVCHGIPSKDVVLKDGDIINVDCSTILDGYFSDSSRMFCMGNVKAEDKKLVDVALECVKIGFAAVKPWKTLGDMAQVINDHAKSHGYSIVREIGGHGIGLEFHEDPWVSYVSSAGEDMLMVPGMIFTIEPMVNMGKHDIVIDPVNEWEVSTKDGMPSAQWEYQILVTEDGAEMICW